MCDCYSQKCKICNRAIPIHIEDFKYPREMVKVFCTKHLPENKITTFEVVGADDFGDFDGYEMGWKCGIRLDDGSIEPNREGVTPNVGSKLPRLERRGFCSQYSMNLK